MTQINTDTYTRLQERLREAESLARDILNQMDGTTPLAGATRELLEVHSEVRSLLLSGVENRTVVTADEKDMETAAIEVAREEHEMKADVKDIIKALFMWKDDPADRISSSD